MLQIIRSVVGLLNYLRNRLIEPSTWASFGVVVTAASVLAYPFNWLAVGLGCIGAMLSEKKA